MRIVLILIITFLILIGCKLNIDDEINNNVNDYKLGTASKEGCIQRSGETIFLINNYDEMLVNSNTIDINELIDGKSYSLRYTQILESNSPVIIVESYQEIDKNYCDKEK